MVLNRARSPRSALVIGLIAAIVSVFALHACSNTSESRFRDTTNGNNNGDQTGAGGAVIAPGGSGGGLINGGGGEVVPPTDAAKGPCVNLQCQQTSCSAGACKEMPCEAGKGTTVSGSVYDPAGKVPLYNIVVYVPNAEVKPFLPGAACDRCDASVLNPATATLTDTHGHFILNDVPVGSEIPLVMQVGKWRRQIKIPTVSRCVDTPLTDKNLTRLPKNKSEGDIPLIAITTGGADSMECLPRRMGIEDAEFTTEMGAGRIHLYSGQDNDMDIATKAFAPTLNAGAVLTPATMLWDTLGQLKKYDIVILSCEGDPIPQEKPVGARDALYKYESIGGRVFASHWHRIWFSDGPAPVPTIGMWDDRDDPPSPIPGTIDVSFPKGAALAEWLVNVQASMTLGQLEIQEARDNIQAVNAAVARQWITIDTNGGGTGKAVEYLSYNAPIDVPEDKKCGRAVFNDLHVSNTSGDMPGEPFPMGCKMGDLSPQEKAVEFMLFDLSSCIQNDDAPPEPPTVIK